MKGTAFDDPGQTLTAIKLAESGRGSREPVAEFIELGRVWKGDGITEAWELIEDMVAETEDGF